MGVRFLQDGDNPRTCQMINVRRQNIFFASGLDAVIPVVPKTGVNITEITCDNIECVADFRSEKYVGTFYRFLEQGQYGVYAWLNSKVVGHAWAKVCRDQSCRVNGYLDICRNEALIHFCNVKADQRGNNIYPAMLAVLCQRLFVEADVSRVLIDTEVKNQASLRGIAKVGFKPLGTGFYIQFRGRLIFKRFAHWNDQVC